MTKKRVSSRDAAQTGREKQSIEKPLRRFHEGPIESLHDAEHMLSGIAELCDDTFDACRYRHEDYIFAAYLAYRKLSDLPQARERFGASGKALLAKILAGSAPETMESAKLAEIVALLWRAHRRYKNPADVQGIIQSMPWIRFD